MIYPRNSHSCVTPILGVHGADELDRHRSCVRYHPRQQKDGGDNASRHVSAAAPARSPFLGLQQRHREQHKTAEVQYAPAHRRREGLDAVLRASQVLELTRYRGVINLRDALLVELAHVQTVMHDLGQ